MILPKQPQESNLEYVVSLSESDIEAIDTAAVQEFSGSWDDTKEAVERAHFAPLPTFPSVPDVFFSYSLGNLMTTGLIKVMGAVDQQLNCKMMATAHAPTS